ncbi:MAG: hypothetical protein WCX69_00405, partial [Candidatus Paceibacterota bacterium]
IIERNVDIINTSFAWHFWKLITEEKSDYEKVFQISHCYLSVIANHFNSAAFNDIFMFIEENIENKRAECYDLLWKVLKTEKMWVESVAKEKNIDGINWWPYYSTGDILKKVRDLLGYGQCLEVVEFLADYPVKLRGRNIDSLGLVLQRIPFEYNKDQRIEKIFDKLIEIDPLYFDAKEKWIKESKIK